jgi:leucine dehydrogenase
MTVTDIHGGRVDRVVKEFGVKTVAPEEIYGLDCDIFSPCALGAVINDETLKEFKCKIICGCANNQLKEARHGDLVQKMGILYAPDYVANSGGTIYDTDRLEVGNVSHERGKEKVSRIYQTMEKLIEISKTEKIPTYTAADRLAEERIQKVSEVKKYGGDLPRIF